MPSAVPRDTPVPRTSARIDAILAPAQTLRPRKNINHIELTMRREFSVRLWSAIYRPALKLRFGPALYLPKPRTIGRFAFHQLFNAALRYPVLAPPQPVNSRLFTMQANPQFVLPILDVTWIYFVRT